MAILPEVGCPIGAQSDACRHRPSPTGCISVSDLRAAAAAKGVSFGELLLATPEIRVEVHACETPPPDSPESLSRAQLCGSPKFWRETSKPPLAVAWLWATVVAPHRASSSLNLLSNVFSVGCGTSRSLRQMCWCCFKRKLVPPQGWVNGQGSRHWGPLPKAGGQRHFDLCGEGSGAG